MRPSPRSLRVLRPAMDALEAIRPVSTLIPSLPLSALAAPGGVTLSEPDDPAGSIVVRVDSPDSLRMNEEARVPVPSLPADPPPPDVTFAVVAWPATEATEPARGETRSQLDPLVAPLLGSVVTIAYASVNMDVSTSFSLPAPVDVGVTVPTPVSPPAPAVASTAVSPQPFAADPRLPTGHSAPAADGIRPMALAHSHAAVDTDSAGGEVMALGDPSGGGGTPEQDPIVGLSGGCSPLTLVGDSPNYRIEEEVPVGSTLGFFVTPPDSHITIMDAHWEGGTEYVNYYHGPSTAVPEAQYSATKNPYNGIGQTSYRFIVDPVARPYTITVNVMYEDNSEGDATVTFTSVAPTVTVDIADQGQAGLTQEGGSAVIRLADTTTQDWPQRAGMHIRVTTRTPATPDLIAGEFMFLQLIAPRRFTQRSNGDNYNLALPPRADGTPAWAIDNSFQFDGNPHPGAIGYVMVYRDNENDSFPEGDSGRTDWNGWELDANDSETYEMGDSPHVATALDSRTLQIGQQTPFVPEKFNTYVMYKPNCGGVWVALARVHWEWGLLARNTNLQGLPANWILDDYPGVPAPSVLNPIGPDDEDDYFPSWDYRTTDLLSHQDRDYPGYPGWFKPN